MAFVNEKISEEDRAKYGIKKAADRWVIDRENGYFFVYTGGADYGRVFFYDLNLDGQVVKVITERHITGSTVPEKKAKNLDDVTYNVEKINIPKNLGMSDKNLKSLIELAFKKSGLFGREEGVASVTVNLPEQLSYYSETSITNGRG